ncbi:MAG TPA: hypothetical protein VMX17_09240 [Candidatus Glassbacteria bacterium]|nr:hypothetical protein [Candidatus Glassbacteria bacterium]
MKRVVKIKESQLNDIIKKVIKEQEGQVMNTGPSPEQVTGTPDAGGEDMATEGPDFEQFIGCAKELLDQGVTVGELVDQLLEAQESEPEDVEEPIAPNPEVDGGIEPEIPMA